MKNLHGPGRPHVRALAFGLLLIGFMVPIWAATSASAAAASPPRPTAALCRHAIAITERAARIPDHLMAAIGRVESGRPDPVSGAWNPWPWTINANGDGFFYDSKAQAVAAVRALQAQGVQSIDVGCMQVNLMHHPDAFPTLEAAFDPQINANYAARFLNELVAQTRDWAAAAALYHSATPELGLDYARRVLAVWPEEKRLAARQPEAALASAWSATLRPAAAGPGTDRLGVAPGAANSMDGSRTRCASAGPLPFGRPGLGHFWGNDAAAIPTRAGPARKSLAHAPYSAGTRPWASAAGLDAPTAGRSGTVSLPTAAPAPCG